MIGLIGAMEQEVAFLTAALEQPCCEVISGVTYHRGILRGQEVVVARAGVGKVNAALCTCTMILLYHPILILNTGVAGALQKELKQGDVVIATSLVQHDMDTTPVGDPRGLLTIGQENLVELQADPHTVQALQQAAIRTGVSPYLGMIASGDQFIADDAQKNDIRAHFPALACEMEGAAVAHAACAAGVPCGVLRVISDGADEEASLDYPSFVKTAAAKSQDIVLSFLSGMETP